MPAPAFGCTLCQVLSSPALPSLFPSRAYAFSLYGLFKYIKSSFSCINAKAALPHTVNTQLLHQACCCPEVWQQLSWECHRRSTHMLFPSSATLPNLPETQLLAHCYMGKTLPPENRTEITYFLYAVCTVQLTALVLIHLVWGTVEGSYTAFRCLHSWNEHPHFTLISHHRVSYAHFQMLQCCTVLVKAASYLQHSSLLWNESEGWATGPSHRHCQVLSSSPGRLFVETGAKIRVRLHILGPNILHIWGFGNKMYKLLDKTISNINQYITVYLLRIFIWHRSGKQSFPYFRNS